MFYGYYFLLILVRCIQYLDNTYFIWICIDDNKVYI